LTLKPSPQINRSRHGVTFCGHRILPGSIRLTARRRRRARDLRRAWEAAYAHAEIDAAGLQRAVAAVLGLSARADALGWRRRDLHLHPAVDA
jgi:hypothetical protein